MTLYDDAEKRKDFINKTKGGNVEVWADKL